MDDRSHLDIADWRREIAELYAIIRALAPRDPVAAHDKYRETRDRLFKSHPASPLDAQQNDLFDGLDYFAYDPAFRVIAELKFSNTTENFKADLPEGLFRYQRFAEVQFDLSGRPQSLGLYWIEGYGGGLFLPFRDATSGHETYGGGRYLIDAIKGADLGMRDGKLLLDFNFAYNPSCAYNERWVCPLAMRENTLDVRIEAGEKVLEH